ncbi:MAG: FAD-binding oxidoreductase [Candidatus Omnitrophica bacterium]|nr:FAD-binding oxidoreductase [Candidatus Omnitrophota bacterium]
MPSEIAVKINEIIQRTYNVKSFRLGMAQWIDFKAGQFMHISLQEGEKYRRYLSISSSPTEQGYIEFTKKLTESDFSKALNNLRPGDIIRVQYPLGKFTLQDNGNPQRIAFLSGGIGITPIRSICKYVLDENLGTDIILVYANKTIADIAFREDFDAMQRQYSKLRITHILSEPAPGFKCRLGLINANIIKEEIQDYPERKFFLCGPPAMVEAMRKTLELELNLPKQNVITENFVGY